MPLRFRHEFQVRAPRARVAAFHRRSASLVEITPPGIPMRFFGELPELLEDGDEMEFRTWLGPIPIRWRARIEGSGEGGFIDRQLAGPFDEWVHHHRFIATDGDSGEEQTTVRDEIDARLPSHPGRAAVALGMWVGLPILFAYRGWKTRRLLERNQET